MLKTIGETKSITQTKSELSKIIKSVNKTGEPVFILNHNNPEAVIISNKEYSSLIEKYHEMEEKIFYSNLSNRIDEGPIELIPAAKVIEKEDTENPFAHLSDEELFD
ncbi:type II toxin-antitoxin system Phd/YefM family antitoxin [Marinilactibacillus psychrotolerans]|uniref:Antitoxin n=3 Tax=Marinilactibacillus TaxID=191769 RepID=A0A5R9C7L8_9LACT|nr:MULTISPECIES: type II toxin-antitoxin system Phd/YefM family antitoxin [Marinilactibacillus]API89878.1 hypothetical protein BKP56_11660 [Marinilactibacillus sp. 15R]TLQ09161.1 type II toxin-antitoxin system Phd/YefM family antitoxin [Marinilactibacillus psychrotolerans]GEQ32304.1 hypothetical protein B795N_01860 [Marinilactibacillus psychrotolerans]SFK37734.1 prevent-host-death family protein [Marinilactibacillus piezotolerans]